MPDEPLNPHEGPQEEVAQHVEDVAVHVIANDGGQRGEDDGEE